MWSALEEAFSVMDGHTREVETALAAFRHTLTPLYKACTHAPPPTPLPYYPKTTYTYLLSNIPSRPVQQYHPLAPYIISSLTPPLTLSSRHASRQAHNIMHLLPAPPAKRLLGR